MLGYIENIPAGSGENGIPHGAQESNILDHHLAADTCFPAKGPAGQGGGGHQPCRGVGARGTRRRGGDVARTVGRRAQVEHVGRGLLQDRTPGGGCGMLRTGREGRRQRGRRQPGGRTRRGRKIIMRFSNYRVINFLFIH